MSHSYLGGLLHIVFTTAERRPPWIRDEMRDRLHTYLGGIARENGMTALAVGGVSRSYPCLKLLAAYGIQEA
ncbi:MAG TPA: hypothetical protein VG649_13315 [Candidatus Angelobacter sp.]|jgi:hypothetical protein|nr:hypothetical protein [Candidatus Angelobacter sp.]